jgi:hypothetical protein
MGVTRFGLLCEPTEHQWTYAATSGWFLSRWSELIPQHGSGKRRNDGST